MFTLLTILILIICALLVLIILVQNPKGGGLNSGVSTPATMGGVKQTADILEKATWIFAISFFVLVILSNAFLPAAPSAKPADQQEETKTKIEDIVGSQGEGQGQ